MTNLLYLAPQISILDVPTVVNYKCVQLSCYMAMLFSKRSNLRGGMGGGT